MNEVSEKNLLERVAFLLNSACEKVVLAVNTTMVQTYFEIGRIIVEDEQNGNERAAYASQKLRFLSENLTQQFGKGFSERNLKNMRQFYWVYSEQRKLINRASSGLQKRQTASAELCKTSTAIPSNSTDLIAEAENEPQTFSLSWSHYLKLIRITAPYERNFYEIEASKNNWRLRELEWQYDTALFTRLALSRDNEQIHHLALQGQRIEKPQDLLKDPYILAFLGLPEQSYYSESELKQKLIEKLEHFLLELGAGFAFVGRPQRISFEEQHFFIDLVFYNRLLRCFVLIDLQIGTLKHQDIGQMQMYVNYYDCEVKLADETPTIGLILCQDKSQAVVKYTLPQENSQIFASQYFTVLPSQETLIQLIKETI